MSQRPAASARVAILDDVDTRVFEWQERAGLRRDGRSRERRERQWISYGPMLRAGEASVEITLYARAPYGTRISREEAAERR